MSWIKFNVPLYLTRGKKKPRNYWLNLNSYRNWKYHLNNDLKIQFKDEIYIPELDKPIDVEVRIKYTFYYPDKSKRDIDNSLAVISKFTGDALVEANVLVDDNYNYVKSIKGVFGGIDKTNPRCEVEVEEII